MPLRTNALMLLDDTIKTITSGAITITQLYHSAAAESGTTDDLDTISIDTAALKTTDGGNTFRPFVVIRADTGDTITVKHGTGNIYLNNAADYALSGNKQLLLFYDGTNWTDLAATATGTGTIGGSTGATDNRIIRADGTGGSTIQSSAVTIDDNGNVSGVNTLGYVDATELTIASGAVTRTASYHRIDTEGDAASDDLDTISGGTAGQKLIIRAENTARDVVIRHNGGGTGNIRTYDGNNITLDETYKAVELIYDGTNWLVVGVTSGGGSGDVVGPASSTDNAIARFDGITGKLLQNSSATVNDSGQLYTPQINDSNGNELIKLTTTASAVNELTIANAATGNAPSIAASGDNTDVGIAINPKGAGAVRINGPVGVNTAPNASALVDMSSTAQGLLIPRMTTAQFAAISSKATGLMAWDTDLKAIVEYDGSAVRQIASRLPKRATMWHDEATVIAGNALIIGIGTSQIYNSYVYQSPSALNDEFEHECYIAAGTYTLSVLGVTSSDSGIITWYVDGGSVGTTDMYSGGASNVIKTVASVVIATSGYHAIRGKLASKNASASDYRAYLNKYWFK